MNDDRSTTRQSFFSRVFAGTTEGEGTAIYSSEEVGTGTPGMSEQEGSAHGFTVERAAEVIKNLPPEVPRLSAVRIVRGTLEAAGIDIAELESSTRARESRLNSEIDLSERRKLWKACKKTRRTRRRSCAVPARSRTPKTTGKPGIKRNREHPTPSGTSRPGFRLQPSNGRPIPR